MLPGSGVYDALIYIYALSLLFVFSDCIRRNAGAKRIGTGLLLVVLVFQVVFMGIRAWIEGRFPVLITYDFLFLFSVIVVMTSLVMSRYQRQEFTVLLLNLIGFSVIVLNKLWFQPIDNPLVNWQTVHGLLILHIALANVGFVALTVAAVFSLLYLFLHHRLKTKKWTAMMRRLPSLEVLSGYTHKAMFIGAPLLGVSVLIAVISIIAEGRWSLLLDLKVLSTAASMCVYVVYLVNQRSNQHSGLIMACWALVGYIFLVMNFMANSWSAFHRWTGG